MVRLNQRKVVKPIKKLLRTILLSLMSVLFALTNITGIHAEEKTPEIVLAEFKEMQDEITENLELSFDGYVYNYETIKKIVNDFDFTDVNEHLNFEYTNESFLEEAIGWIDETDTRSLMMAPRASCNAHYQTSGWNYDRWYMRSSYIPTWLYETRKVVNNNGLAVGGIAIIIGAMPGAILGLADLGYGWYWNGLMNEVEYKNTGCGVVYDIDKYVGMYFLWD